MQNCTKYDRSDEFEFKVPKIRRERRINREVDHKVDLVDRLVKGGRIGGGEGGADEATINLRQGGGGVLRA